MTLKEIAQLPGEFISARDAAEYLNSTENTINCAAREGMLPWAYKLGRRTMIPKRAFVHEHRFGHKIVPPVQEF